MSILGLTAALSIALADPQPTPGDSSQAKPQASSSPAGAGAPAPSAAPASPDFKALADQALAQLKERLKLTDDQVVKIRPLLADHLAKVRQIFVDYGDPSGVSFPALVQAFRAQRSRFQTSLVPILTPAQNAETDVIRKEVDQKLKDTICDERVASLKGRLSLSDDQVTKVRPILCQDFERKREVMGLMTTPAGGPAVRRSARPEIKAIQENTESQLRQVLTAEQMKAYEAYRNQLTAAARQVD